MEVEERVRDAGPQLTTAERRVAQVVLERPQLVGFGTVADLAEAAGGRGRHRRAAGRQARLRRVQRPPGSIQRDLAHQLRPAAERIRELGGDQPITRHRAAELSNVQATLDAVDPATLDAVVGLLADLDREVLVLAGDAERGIALQFATDLGALRAGVAIVHGSDVTVRRQLALAAPGATLVVIDLRRYERWVLEAFEQAKGAGHTIVALTDGVLSPLAMGAAPLLRHLRGVGVAVRQPRRDAGAVRPARRPGGRAAAGRRRPTASSASSRPGPRAAPSSTADGDRPAGRRPRRARATGPSASGSSPNAEARGGAGTPRRSAPDPARWPRSSRSARSSCGRGPSTTRPGRRARRRR